eukprot:3140859-Alexandrium_andersonii.AAC.1
MTTCKAVALWHRGECLSLFRSVSRSPRVDPEYSGAVGDIGGGILVSILAGSSCLATVRVCWALDVLPRTAARDTPSVIALTVGWLGFRRPLE